MSDEEFKIFLELINGIEIVGSLTEEGRSLIKRGVQRLVDENNKLKGRS